LRDGQILAIRGLQVGAHVANLRADFPERVSPRLVEALDRSAHRRMLLAQQQLEQSALARAIGTGDGPVLA